MHNGNFAVNTHVLCSTPRLPNFHNSIPWKRIQNDYYFFVNNYTYTNHTPTLYGNNRHHSECVNMWLANLLWLWTLIAEIASRSDRKSRTFRTAISRAFSFPTLHRTRTTAEKMCHFSFIIAYDFKPKPVFVSVSISESSYVQKLQFDCNFCMRITWHIRKWICSKSKASK